MSDILNQHAFHPATSETAPRHNAIRLACIDLANAIEENVPNCPERDEAQKMLHIVRMWANMGIAVNGAPMATPEQAVAPSRTMTCPNCGDMVNVRPSGIVNPHWVQTDGYEKDGFSCV